MWEKIDETTERLKVHNGWLVHRRITKTEIATPQTYSRHETHEYRTTACMVFVVDQTHQWKLDS